jgi:hypothetical protein
MRTTLDIEDDVLQAAKELAKREGTTAGQVLSALARKGLNAKASKNYTIRNGVPVLASRGEIITIEKIQAIMDEEGI